VVEGVERMYFMQIAFPGMGFFSHAMGCPAAQGMIVVGPERDVQDYLDIFGDEGLKITPTSSTPLSMQNMSADVMS
jgi:hypothetical protein